jgi:hypothetical protein
MAANGGKKKKRIRSEALEKRHLFNDAVFQGLVKFVAGIFNETDCIVSHGDCSAWQWVM